MKLHQKSVSAGIHKVNFSTYEKNLFSSSLKRNFLFILIIYISIFISSPGAYSAPISADRAEGVANSFINYINASRTIDSIQELQSNDKPVAYLVSLSPSGYILIAGDDIRVPVKGYSLKSDFFNLPEAYRQTLLEELEVPAVFSVSSTSSQESNVNDTYWNFLTPAYNKNNLSVPVQTYTPDTFLLTTHWGQDYPYNSFNPQISGEYTLTGCVQTAIAQLMRYHGYPSKGSGVFTLQYNSETLTAVMNRPFNWSEMPDIVDGSVPKYQRDEVAILMRDIAILNQATFGVSGTSTSFRSDEFSRAFGYAPVLSMYISNSSFFDTIKSEIDSERPVLLSMPNHMVVADGYASDGAGKKIHLNMGWDGAEDDYYFLDQTNTIGPYSFPPEHTIYYNIRPCAGDECNPYPPTENGNPPEIISALPDTVIDGTGTTIYIEANDPDGDDVTLSVSSSCDDIDAEIASNLLTLTPAATDNYCQIKVKAASSDGTASRTFNTLAVNDTIYLGSGFDIGGQFADVTETDEYYAYLSGNTTISGTRGYTTQAFYIWVEDENGSTTVVSPVDSAISYNFSPGIYKINASLSSGSSFYLDNEKTGYIISVSMDNQNYTVADLADARGITLQEFAPALPEDIPLSSGWNLISLNKEPDNTVISSVLSQISDKVKSVWAYDSGNWKVYDPVSPGFNTLAAIEAGKGYWFNMTGPVDLNITGNTPAGSVNLLQGWNLVGYNLAAEKNIADAMSSVEGSYISVWAYKNGQWLSYSPANSGFNTLDVMEPGYGYWIKAIETCTWEP